MSNPVRKPTIIIPYNMPCATGECEDIFVYLRPESNGFEFESTLFKVVKESPLYMENIKLVYLANIPGDFIVRNHIIEEHYSVKFHFSVVGKKAFTPKMKLKFQSFFQTDFEKAQIVGAFEYMYDHNLTPEQLFNIWVPPYELMVINGQSVKHIDDFYILNYDIPALLHKNSNKTDIAVMVFRSRLKRPEFKRMIEEIGESFVAKKIMDGKKPPSRCFHYSKGPFEQILDGIGYLYDKEGRHIDPKKMSFFHYLLEKGLDKKEILGLLRNPILEFQIGESLREENILDLTTGDTYKEAFDMLKNARSQRVLR